MENEALDSTLSGIQSRLEEVEKEVTTALKLVTRMAFAQNNGVGLEVKIVGNWSMRNQLPGYGRIGKVTRKDDAGYWVDFGGKTTYPYSLENLEPTGEWS